MVEIAEVLRAHHVKVLVVVRPRPRSSSCAASSASTGWLLPTTVTRSPGSRLKLSHHAGGTAIDDSVEQRWLQRAKQRLNTAHRWMEQDLPKVIRLASPSFNARRAITMHSAGHRWRRYPMRTVRRTGSRSTGTWDHGVDHRRRNQKLPIPLDARCPSGNASRPPSPSCGHGKSRRIQ